MIRHIPCSASLLVGGVGDVDSQQCETRLLRGRNLADTAGHLPHAFAPTNTSDETAPDSMFSSRWTTPQPVDGPPEQASPSIVSGIRARRRRAILRQQSIGTPISRGEADEVERRGRPPR